MSVRTLLSLSTPHEMLPRDRLVSLGFGIDGLVPGYFSGEKYRDGFLNLKKKGRGDWAKKPK